MNINLYEKRDIHSRKVQAEKLDQKEVKYFIYFLIDDGEIIYIGKTIQPDQRLATHRRGKESRKFTHYTLIECNSEEEMNMLESLHIIAYAPPQNKTRSIKAIGLGIQAQLEGGQDD